VPGQTYSWSVLGTAPAVLSSTTAANPVVTVFGPTDGQPDTVQVQVQASNGACEFQDVVSIVVLPQPLVAVSGLGATYCAGDTIALTAGPAEGYLWQASDPASLLSNTTGPTVQLKAVPDLSVSLLVFADGCSGLPITLSVPVVPLPVIEVLGPDRVCAGETVNLTAIGAETWLWPDGQTTSSVSFIPTRDTVVTLQGFNGGGLCAAAEVQRLVRYTTVPTPVLQAPDTVVCQEQSITFRALGTADRWEWQFDDGALASAANVQNPPVVRYLNTGTKTVRLRAYINGCPSAEVTRTLLVLPKTNIAIEPNPDQCFNEHGFTFRATDVPGSNYEWTFGPQGVVPTSAEPTPSGIRFQRPGSFSVGLRVFNEVCSEEATTRVTVLPSPNPPTVAPYDSLCPEFVLQLIATVPAGENLTWYADSSGTRVVGFGRRFTTPPATVTDTFYVRSTNRFGCQSFPTAVPVYRYPRVPLAIASPTRILYLPRAVGVLEPAAQDSQIIAWLWDIDRGGHVYTTQQAVHTFQRPGLYTVTLTTVDRFGCANAVIESDYFDVRELENLAIPNAFSPNGDRLNDEWFVYHLNVMDYTLRMFARDGGLVFETRDPNFRWDGTTPGGSLCPEGVYTYRIVARDYRGQPIERSGTVTLLR
jgi:gliding motility-associated-like protein